MADTITIEVTESNEIITVEVATSGDMNKSVYDPALIAEQLVGLIASQSLTNKTINGVVLDSAGLSTDFLNGEGNYISLVAQPANAILVSAKVNEAGGILAGNAVYISGATGGFPRVSLSDNSTFSKGDVLAIATESKSNNQTIQVCTSGLVENIDTSAFLEGDILYLGLTGNVTKDHPTGIDAVQRLGHVVKVNASTGSMIVELDMLTIINDHNGTMRHQVVNQNAGEFASAGYTLVNDAGHRSSINYRSSVFTGGNSEILGIYNEGYNKTIFTVDGNFGFEWNTDESDSHSFAATPKMILSASGELIIKRLKTTNTPYFDDDTAAGVGGLVIGQTYQTTGSGAAPLNVAGILMVKQ